MQLAAPDSTLPTSDSILAACVLFRLVSDACAHDDNPNRQVARQWLLGKCREVETLCKLAGVRVAKLRHSVRTLADTGWRGELNGEFALVTVKRPWTAQDLRQKTCQYPRGERPDWNFCGNKTLDGTSYCEEHHVKCHLKKR